MSLFVRAPPGSVDSWMRILSKKQDWNSRTLTPETRFINISCVFCSECRRAHNCTVSGFELEYNSALGSLKFIGSGENMATADAALTPDTWHHIGSLC
jgi:hypothetical protein